MVRDSNPFNAARMSAAGDGSTEPNHNVRQRRTCKSNPSSVRRAIRESPLRAAGCEGAKMDNYELCRFFAGVFGRKNVKTKEKYETNGGFKRFAPFAMGFVAKLT